MTTTAVSPAISRTPALFGSSFKALQVDVPSGASLFILYREASSKGASLPALVLLHGYPQTHTTWHDVVKGLPSDLAIVVPDLPGYGQSKKTPSSDGSHAAHSKRAMATDVVDLIDALFPGEQKQFVAIGHDRGARVAYRIGLDHGTRVKGVCTMAVIPFTETFGSMRLDADKHKETFRMYHWIFLALPPPLPETMIGHDPEGYISYTINSWTGSAMKNKHAPEMMKTWTDPYVQSKDAIAGSLEDYRAGATIDLDHEVEDRAPGSTTGGKVSVPLLNLYGAELRKRFNVEGIWASHFDGSKGAALRQQQVGGEGVGHFLPNEVPQETAQALVEWLAQDVGFA